MLSRSGWFQLDNRTHKSRRRKRHQARRSFFERLEDRLVLNGIPIAKEDLGHFTAVNAALNIGSGNPTLVANDWDPEGSSLTASVVANPAHGTLSSFNGSTGTVTYTPDTDYNGLDSFTYKVNDGTSDSDIVTVSIAVGGHFGPRTNLEEQPVAFAGGCSANTTPLTFSGSCLTGDLEYAQTLTPGLKLLYNSGTLPQPIIVFETFLQSTSAVPDEIKAKLTFNGVAGTDYSYDTTGLEAGDALRFALQADATALSTGRYAYTVRLTARFDATNVYRDYTGYALVVNRGDSGYAFGRGWQLAGLDSLVDVTGGMMLVRSTGDALFFPDDGAGGYELAEGDESFSTLEEIDDTFTLTDKHGIQANFSAAGLLISQVDRNDNTTTFTYSTGKISEITDPFDRDTTFTYDSGQLSSVTDFAGRTASLSYTSGDLTTVTQPDPDSGGALTAPVWEFTYDGTSHLLTEVEDPLNHDTDFAYGSHERLTSIAHSDANEWELTALQTIGLPTGSSGNALISTNPLGTVEDENESDWTFRTDRHGLVTQWIFPGSQQTLIQRSSVGLPIKLTEADPDAGGPLTSPITIFGYSSLGNLRYQKNSDNSTRTWTYSGTFNQPLTATDELNRVYEYTYDGDGNLTEIEDPADFATTFTVNGLGLVTSMVTPDPDGGGGLTAAETTYDYDEFGRLETITYDDESTRVLGYDSADHLTSDEDELEHTATYVYDLLGRLTSATDREEAQTSYAYNALGLLTKVTNALSKETDYEYNERNFLVSVLQPDPDGGGALGRPETEYGYDAVGNRTTMGQGAYFSTPLTYGYSANRLVSISQTVDQLTYTTTYSLDNLGRVTNVHDALDHDTSYVYSSRGLVTKITGHDPDGAGPGVGPITEFAYDAAGQQTSVTDPRGYVTTTTYDSRGLPTLVTQPDPDGTGPQWAPATYYIYDNVGRLNAIDDALCRITMYAYDSRDRVTSVTLPDPDGAGGASPPVWSFGYDDAGRRTSVTDPLSRVTSYTFDDVGRMLTQTDPDPDAGGGLLSPVTTNVYNALGSLTSVTDPRSKVTTYAYDHLQRLTTITLADPDGGGGLSSPVITYVYGSNTLLSKITDPLSHDTDFSYDGLGRKTGITDEQGNETTLEYNKVNQVISVTLPDPDDEGELESPVTEYGYDAYNRLATITDPLSGLTVFTYDKANNLLSVQDPELNVTSYAYDNIGRLAIETNELDDSRSFTYDPASNLTRRVDRNGRIIQFVRDDLDRITAEEWYDDGTPVPSLSIATTTEGGVFNEVQRVGFTGLMLSGGTFTLSFNGNTTSGIAYNASAATVQSALEALGSVGSGNVAVTKLQNSASAQEWRLTFQGSLGATNVAQTTINSSSVSGMGLSNIQATDTTGATLNEVQTVTLSNATGGTFRLAFLGEITPPLDYDASSSALDTALENLNAVDEVTVSGDPGGPWTVTFVGDHSGTNVAKLNGDTANATSGDLVRTINYVYDAASQLTSAFDPDSGYDYTYDNLGRVLTVDNDDTPDVPRVVLTNAYDAAGNRTSLSATVDSTNDFQNTYTYDSLNRLTRVDQTGFGGNTVAEKRVDLAYNSLGQFTSIARYKDTDGGSTNEIATAIYSYDTLNRLTDLAYQNDSTDLFDPYSYTYDDLSNLTPLPLGARGPGMDPRVAALARGAIFSGLGRITQMTSQDGSSDYTYDETSQLTGADHSYQPNETYTYDSNGNRTMDGYETGPNNQLLDNGAHTYEYDSEGNRTRREKTFDGSSTEYEWDFRNRLVRVTEIDSEEEVTQIVEYTYDIFDRRIDRMVDNESPFDFQDAGIERYVLDDLNGVLSLDGGNVVLDFVDPDGTSGEEELVLGKRYLYGNQVDHLYAQEDAAVSIESADRVFWPLVDHLQTVRDLYRNDATSSGHYQYDSFGNILDGDLSKSRYFYTSRETDIVTAMQLNRARWYDTTVGIWTRHDPIGFGAADFNTARYVANRPTSQSDPTGLQQGNSNYPLAPGLPYASPARLPDFSTMTLGQIVRYYNVQVPYRQALAWGAMGPSKLPQVFKSGLYGGMPIPQPTTGIKIAIAGESDFPEVYADYSTNAAWATTNIVNPGTVRPLTQTLPDRSVGMISIRSAPLPSDMVGEITRVAAPYCTVTYALALVMPEPGSNGPPVNPIADIYIRISNGELFPGAVEYTQPIPVLIPDRYPDGSIRTEAQGSAITVRLPWNTSQNVLPTR